MIRISQLKLPVSHNSEALMQKAAKLLKLSPHAIKELKIRRRSLDARKKPELFYIYTVDVKVDQEKKVVHRAKNPNIQLFSEIPYHLPPFGSELLQERPVVIGAGPAGLFCALMLARQGFAPILFERGLDVESRRRSVDLFWESGVLDLRSNVQFGEGGAGTFSDGKLNTMVKDPKKYGNLVMETLYMFGADAEILYESKPHIGTDILADIVKNIREEIIRLGGSVRFCCQITDLLIENGSLRGVLTEYGECIPASVAVLAVGHSARDTFFMLHRHHVPMDAKAFAVGLRIQHPQAMINHSQYGSENAIPGAASYKLTFQSSGGRGVYSFCMCPGGYVVDASSEAGRLAVNGMSYHDRSGTNANSALIVTVTPEDFSSRSPLGGIEFQRTLEEAAFQSASGRIPVQLYGDFKRNRPSTQLGEIQPQICGRWELSNIRSWMPEYLAQPLLESMEFFGTRIDGFERYDALFAGIESRTSSPVRIWRDEHMESQIRGLYPCGEGAGYAGGITSAAMDGIRTAEAILSRFRMK